MPETAMEAMARATRPLLHKIASTVLHTAHDPDAGDEVKVCGEFYRFVRLERGVMVLTSCEDDHCNEWRYGPTDGEQFVGIKREPKT